MSWNKGVMFFKGDLGNDPDQLAKTIITNPIDDAALDTLHTYLVANYTDCNKASRSFVETTAIVVSAPAADANVDRRAVIVMQDASNGSTVRIEIPAPVSSMTENDSDGERVTDTAVADIAAQISTATGRTLVGKYGYVIQKK